MSWRRHGRHRRSAAQMPSARWWETPWTLAMYIARSAARSSSSSRSAVDGEQRRADARRQLVAADRRRRGEGVGDRRRPLRDGAGVGDAGHQDDELVATPAADEVGLPHRLAQPVGGGDERLVAGVVPDGVVDDLEVVEVDHHQAGAAARRDRGGPGSPSPAARTPPDWAAGSGRPSSPGAAAPDGRRSSRRGRRRRAPRRRRAGRRSASARRRSGARRPGRSCAPPTGRPRTRPSTARRTSGRRRPCGPAGAARPPRARARRPCRRGASDVSSERDDVQPAGTLVDADDDLVAGLPSSAATATAGTPRRDDAASAAATAPSSAARRRSCRARRTCRRRWRTPAARGRRRSPPRRSPGWRR